MMMTGFRPTLIAMLIAMPLMLVSDNGGSHIKGMNIYETDEKGRMKWRLSAQEALTESTQTYLKGVRIRIYKKKEVLKVESVKPGVEPDDTTKNEDTHIFTKNCQYDSVKRTMKDKGRIILRSDNLMLVGEDYEMDLNSNHLTVNRKVHMKIFQTGKKIFSSTSKKE